MRYTRTLSCAVASVGALTALAATPAGAMGAAQHQPAAAVAGVVPPAGSPTAFGYTAMTRHDTSPSEDRGTLDLLAPDGRSKTIGEVPKPAQVLDVSNNARTVVTGFWESEQLRLTIWDTETGKPTYLRVNGGSDVAIVKDGLVVSRYSGGSSLYSRSGQLLKAYKYASGSEVEASADGTRVMESSRDGRVAVRRAADGVVLRRVPLPVGMGSCRPAKEFDRNSFSMDCADTVHEAPDDSTAFRAGYAAAVKTTAHAPHLERSGEVRRLDAGLIAFNMSAGTPGQQPAIRDSAGVGLALEMYDGVEPSMKIVGAYGTSIYLSATESQSENPTHTVKRFDLKTYKANTIAGPGSTFGGIVTSAQTVDGT